MKDLSKLNKLRVRHHVEYSEGFTYRPDDDLTQYTNVDDITLKRAPSDTLEGVANQLLIAAERAEQAEKLKQAKAYDRSYVERADYSITSLYSDYKDLIEAGEKDWTDYQQERKKWRRCRYKFCLNVYPIDSDNFRGLPARRSDSRYCSDECKHGQNEANKRFKQYGTYMHVKDIAGLQTDSINDRERERVAAYSEIDLQIQFNKRHEHYINNVDNISEKVLKRLAETGE